MISWQGKVATKGERDTMVREDPDGQAPQTFMSLQWQGGDKQAGKNLP